MTGEVGWMLSLLLLLFLASANISQAASIENSDVEEVIKENADSSTSEDVELVAEIPDEDDKELIDELIPAKYVRPRGRKRRPYKIILL
ncbi:unnamed protein product [Hymenolepis diminuta]|uniref:Expressed conserved protein n=1 Tax=Hymenolepis diminuta TaxID=6216 RepID=A0A0R3SKS0_HYMDI|nr:unnamed protein product [Hymenolepis diminuta]